MQHGTALHCTEADWQTTVVDYAHLTGWLALHIPTTQDATGRHRTAVAYDGAGFPDLILTRNRIIYAELKTQQGRLTPNQQTWRNALTKAGAEYYVWRPSDWNQIIETLK